jgi:hypothetical protein
VQALYSRAIGPYFNLQAGVRHDFEPKARSYAAFGVEGLAPYWFEVEAHAFVSTKGDVLGRLAASYDQRITQRLILQPRVEFNLAAQDVIESGIGAGLSDAEFDLRLRYEIVREFAPYIGISHSSKFGAPRASLALTAKTLLQPPSSSGSGPGSERRRPTKTAKENAMTSYRSLALQTAISGVIMYLVMFVMIDQLSSFYNNLNMLYMTLMMVAPMVVLMIVAMRDMFPSKRLNVLLLAGSAVAFFGSFALIRTQTTIDDTAFIRSMIPHHSGAILMCEQASLTDRELISLCRQIIKSQREEIAQMKSMLEN